MLLNIHWPIRKTRIVVLLLALSLSPPIAFCRHVEGSENGGSENQQSTAHDNVRWAAKTGHELPSYGKGLSDVAMSRDGRLMLTAGRVAIVWDVESGNMLRVLPGAPSENIRLVAFSEDSTEAVTASSHAIVVWNVETGEPLRVFPGNQTATSLALTRDGRMGATVTYDGPNALLSIRNLQSGDVTARFSIGASERRITRIQTIALNMDATRALMVTFAGHASLWDVENTNLIRDWETGQKLVVHAGLSADGKTGLTGTFRNDAIVWDLESGEQVQHLRLSTKGQSRAMRLSDDARWLLTGNTTDNRAILWDVATGEKAREFVAHDGSVNAVAFNHGATRVLTGSQHGSASVWDLTSERRLQAFRGRTVATRRVVSSGQGNDILVMSENGLLVSWNLWQGTVRRLTTESSVAIDPALSHDGSTAIALASPHGALLWDTKSGRQRGALSWNDTICTALALNNDGSQALTGYQDGSVVIWESDTGRKVRTLAFPEPGENAVRVIALDLAGTTAISGHQGGAALQWSLDSGKLIRKFQQENVVHSASITDEGKRILIADSKKAVLIEANSGRQIRRFGISHGFGERAFMSGDGERLLLHSAWNRGRVVGPVDNELQQFDFGPSICSIGFTGRFVFQTLDHHVSVLDAASGVELARLVSLDDGQQWLAFTPDLSYDGSPEGRKLVAFCIFDPVAESTEPVEPTLRRLVALQASLRASRLVDGLLPALLGKP